MSTVLGPKGGPIVAATDWMKALPDLVRPWIDAPFITLGTDGFGRSDTRDSLRSYFEIDPPSIAAAALSALARAGDITAERLRPRASPSWASIRRSSTRSTRSRDSRRGAVSARSRRPARPRRSGG